MGAWKSNPLKFLRPRHVPLYSDRKAVKFPMVSILWRFHSMIWYHYSHLHII